MRGSVVPLNRRLPEPLDAALALLGSPEGAAHWLTKDQDRLARLLPAARWAAVRELAALADRLGGAAAELRRVAVAQRLGEPATQYCLPIAVAIDDAVAEAHRLLGELRAAAHRAEQLLAELVSVAGQVRGRSPGLVSSSLRRVLDEFDELDDADADRWVPATNGAPGHRCAGDAWPQPTGRLFQPEPGIGPVLGGTDGQRPSTDTGVRVAQLSAGDGDR